MSHRSFSRIILGLSVLFVISIGQVQSQTADYDYLDYHRDIIRAEESIFMRGESKEGLAIFKETFDKVDFAFVDDCLEAFQLALHFNEDTLAMDFMKKAIRNGFDIAFLDLLNLGCPCTYYQTMCMPVKIYKPFIEKNHSYLLAYQEVYFPKYLERIHKDLLLELMYRNVNEQLFKKYVPGVGLTATEHKARYREISAANLAFIDSLAKQNLFLGEQNMGLYSDQLMERLGLPTIDSIKNEYKRQYQLPMDQYIPTVRTEEVFIGGQPDFIIYYHNDESYSVLSKYMEAAMRAGYWHPRSMARLKNEYRPRFSNRTDYPRFEPTKKALVNIELVNRIRDNHHMCSSELDKSKHEFAHQHNLHLFFGFFSGTK